MAAADLELDLDELGRRVGPEEVQIDLGVGLTAPADPERGLREAPRALAAVVEIGGLADPPGDVVEGGMREPPVADAGEFRSAALARQARRQRQGREARSRRHGATEPVIVARTVTSSSTLNIRNRGAESPSVRMSSSKVALAETPMSSSLP